ncbi:MAG: hypothetical protein U9O94_04710 [Nanoarchaeota archaeon]|nr:hypothetical protein [Nanoarchaeota archaeon]
MNVQLTDVTWAKIIEALISLIILIFLIIKLFILRDVIDISFLYATFG